MSHDRCPSISYEGGAIGLHIGRKAHSCTCYWSTHWSTKGRTMQLLYFGARSQHVRLEQVYLGSSCVDLTTVSHPPRRGQLPTALSHTSTLIECRSKTSHSIEKYRGITCIKPMRVTKQLMPARAWGSQSHHLVDASTVASTVASTIRGCRIGGCSTIASAIGGCSIRGSIRGGGGRI